MDDISRPAPAESVLTTTMAATRRQLPQAGSAPSRLFSRYDAPPQALARLVPRPGVLSSNGADVRSASWAFSCASYDVLIADAPRRHVA